MHICENSKYLKSDDGTSVTECDKIIIVMDNVSTKKDKYYVTGTVSISCHSKN